MVKPGQEKIDDEVEEDLHLERIAFATDQREEAGRRS